MTRSGWGWVVVAGWLALALTPLVFAATGVPAPVTAVLGVVLVAAGCLLIVCGIFGLLFL